MWAVHCWEIERATEKAKGRSSASKGGNFGACPACKGVHRVGQESACERCKGSGIVRIRSIVSRAPKCPVSVVKACGEVMQARAFIQAYGLDAWMRLNGEPTPELFEAIAVIDGALERLRLEAEIVESVKR